MTATPTISKSQFIKGQQCPKALWYYKNRKDLAIEPDAATQAMFDAGNEVGILAQKYFGKGVEVTDEYWNISAAVKSTDSYVKAGHEVIFEATAMHPGLGSYSRIDILKKVDNSNEWDLIEVKSSTEVKDYHHDDLGFQYHVFTNAGYKIRNCFLMRLNNGYSRQGDIDPQGLFLLEDITQDVLDKQTVIEALVPQLINARGQEFEPEARIGARCKKPFECDYKAHCWSDVPDYSIYSVLTDAKASAAYDITKSYEIADLPEALYPGGNKLIDIDCFLNDREYVEMRGIQVFLDKLEYPLYYLDYESIFPALPQFDNVRPYQQLVFQFSLHIQQEAGGELVHHEFLHTDNTDPREHFAKALIAVCGNSGSVIVWNQTFEKGRNRELAEVFPVYAEALRAINARVVDQMVPFRERVLYRPQQTGSYSLKKVLPAFTGYSYGGMDIANGGDASLQYFNFVRGKLTASEQTTLWEALIKYCKLDTYAMVQIMDVLVRKSLKD
jgi:hypothetical protein